ncbi:MAG: rod shape-determining protein MreD [Planctomycetaceae bacterium]|nr:rod shape-determining protein MreD [Planctomycetaceae bacterium]
MIILMLGILTYSALVMETGRGAWFVPAETMPQLLFLVAAIAALRCRGAGAIVWAVVTGLLADVVQGGPLGLHCVLLANLTFLSQMVGMRRFRGTVITAAAAILVYVAIAGFVGSGLRALLTSRALEWQSLGISAVSRAGGTAVVYLLVMIIAALVVRMVRLIFRRGVPSERPAWAR